MYDKKLCSLTLLITLDDIGGFVILLVPFIYIVK
jgi:hypothetical protein